MKADDLDLKKILVYELCTSLENFQLYYESENQDWPEPQTVPRTDSALNVLISYPVFFVTKYEYFVNRSKLFRNNGSNNAHSGWDR